MENRSSFGEHERRWVPVGHRDASADGGHRDAAAHGRHRDAVANGGEPAVEPASPPWASAHPTAEPEPERQWGSVWADQPVAEAPELPRREVTKPPWKRILGVLVAAGALILKFGGQLKGLLFLLPKIKFLGTAVSMVISIGAYALFWGWQFAVGIVALLFVHELGHVFQARREGIKTTAPMFVPFLGALIMLREREKDAAMEARIGLAGPVLGSLGCLVPLGLFFATGNQLFQALTFTGFFLNLFNLVPVFPLDGGRAMAALSPWMWFVGFAAMIGLFFLIPNPILLLVLLFGGLESWRRFKARKSPEEQAYNRVPKATRFAIAGVYVGLAVALAGGMTATYLERVPEGAGAAVAFLP